MSVIVHLPRDHYGLLPAVYQWCKDNISVETWNMKVWHRHQIYTFENNADAAMFMLRWGGKIGDASEMRKIIWREIKNLTLRAEEHNPPWASASISEGDMKPIAEWIKETGCGRRTSFDTVRFRSEADMSMFLLRWSNQ